ncbi:UNVERIFIED_CONTAM: hypothetical protein Cloal_3817 [Acetivibrio alkalicellulosi]
MKCPKCKLENTDDAMRCDCGYDFTTGKMEQSYLKKYCEFKKPSTLLVVLGWIFSILGGLIGIIIAYSIAFGRSNSNYGHYEYDEESRKMGKIMLIVGICIFVFSILIFNI